MSRVHDALRRAELAGMPQTEPQAPVLTNGYERPAVPEPPPFNGSSLNGSPVALPPVRLNLNPGMLGDVPVVPFQPAPESHLLDLNNSHETPAEEFRTLRTRLNHLQTLQPLHTVIVTSPSPAEGK